MPNIHQQQIFRTNKIKALLGLLDSLDQAQLPTREGVYLTTGNIEDYIDAEHLPLQRGALLAILREAEVPHDTNNRFLPLTIYGYEGALSSLYRDYVGASKVTRVVAPAPEEKN